ncbi:hypothetical protein M0R04_15160 [Candidatus Dojkabacteria bacterium]|jgi:hypothetical protein|nr:hypothetical protein [Candidatus Dojkabacteria bacterium]
MAKKLILAIKQKDRNGRNLWEHAKEFDTLEELFNYIKENGTTGPFKVLQEYELNVEKEQKPPTITYIKGKKMLVKPPINYPIVVLYGVGRPYDFYPEKGEWTMTTTQDIIVNETKEEPKEKENDEKRKE